MSIDPNRTSAPRIGATGDLNAQAANPANATDFAAFRRLLESFEQIAAAHRESPPAIEGPDEVSDALARADEEFSLAMDLRRRLEDAFQKRMP